MEAHKCLLTLTGINNGHRVLLLHGGIGKVHGGLLILLKVTMEMHQVLTERCDLLNAVFGKILLDKTFLNSITLLQMDRLQLTAVHCNRREIVNTTPQMTRFRGAKVCSKWLQERIDDHNIQSDYKYKSGLKVRIQYWYVMLAVTLHDYTTDTNDDMTTMTVFHTEHINTNI